MSKHYTMHTHVEISHGTPLICTILCYVSVLKIKYIKIN